MQTVSQAIQTVSQVKDRVAGREDQDYYVNLLANHKGHIARSKAKAARYYEVNRFKLEHPILWKLGARPARPKKKKRAA